MKRTTVRRTKRLSRDPGELAETIAREQYDLTGLDADFADLSAKTTSTVYEVKSTATTIGEQYREAGRFRLWKKQHEKLTRRDRTDTAFYIFVLFDVSSRPPVAKLVRKDPSAIGRIVAGRGGFYDSGHASKGHQHKLPIDAVF
jgi:hypothetical protein